MIKLMKPKIRVKWPTERVFETRIVQNAKHRTRFRLDSENSFFYHTWGFYIILLSREFFHPHEAITTACNYFIEEISIMALRRRLV